MAMALQRSQILALQFPARDWLRAFKFIRAPAQLGADSSKFLVVKDGDGTAKKRTQGIEFQHNNPHSKELDYQTQKQRRNDSQKFEDVLDTSNTASDVWADSAYRSDEIEEKLAARGLKSRIHRRAYRNRKLSEAQKAANTTRSKVRARVEHVFGDQKNGMGAKLVRTIGIVRARCKIGMTNLVYNMRRFVCLARMAAAAR